MFLFACLSSLSLFCNPYWTVVSGSGFLQGGLCRAEDRNILGSDGERAEGC